MKFKYEPVLKPRVYFAQRGFCGPIKIGFSADPYKRVTRLQTGAGGEFLVLRLHVPGTKRTEKALHRRFRRDRIIGEWFKTSVELLDFVRALEAHRDRELSALVSSLTAGAM